MPKKVSAPVCESNDLQEVISCYDDAVRREYRGINPRRKGNVRDLLEESFKAVDQHTDDAIQKYKDKMREVTGDDSGKYTAYRPVFDPDQAALQATEIMRDVEEDLLDFSSRTDVTDMLTRYSEGYDLYRAACDGTYGEPLCAALHEKHAHLDDILAGMTDNNFHLKKITQYLRFSPYSYYTVAQDRTGVGVGVGLEFLAPVKDTHFALGAETRLVGYPVFNDPNIFSGKLTTLEYNFIPPLFEFGYQGDKTTILFQGGLWFSPYDLYDQGASPNPYSKDILDNPHLQLGAKAYLFGNKMRVGAGFLQTPWGPSFYTEMGYSFGGSKP